MRTRAIVTGICALAAGLAGCESRTVYIERTAWNETRIDPRNEHRPAAAAEDARLLALLDEDYQSQLRRSPVEASRRGDRRYDARLTDLSPQAAAEWVAESRRRLDALQAIDRARLSEDNRINAALLERALRERIEGERFREWQIQVTGREGPHQSLPQLPDTLTFTTEQHHEDYVRRLEAIPQYVDQAIANMRVGLREGRTPPRIVMIKVPAQAATQADEKFVREPETHALFAPLRARGKDDALAARAREAISRGAVPAFARLAAFLEREYVPHCRESVSAADLPDGPEYYRFQLRRMTTTDMTPDEIHNLGLTEVARIRAEMMGVIARSDFPRRDELAGDDLFRAFLEYLRTDPRFYCTTGEELLAGYRDVAKRWDAELPRLFRRMPRLPYGVREMPLYTAPTQTTAYYQSGNLENGQAGFFVANTYKLDERPKYDMVPLTLHEASPGHHHQVALAQEMENQPEWRRYRWFTAFGEGWALYSERLGLEVGEGRPDSVYAPAPAGASPTPRPAPGEEGYKGMYQHPYDDFGRLTYEMWRAMRLVVDTGLHSKGWSRDRAIQYMLDNSGLTRENIEREVDRYIAWPGQACAYKIGELRIRALRDRAEKTLGERFDIRDFHDTILGSGSIPLDVLEARIDAWINERR